MGKLHNYIPVAALLMLVSSCSVEQRTTISNPPFHKPFVYETKLNINGNITKDEKIRLTNDLGNYWDDSIRVRKVSQLGVRYVIKNPAAYDTANLVRSIQFMNEYLNSQGYYSANYAPEITTEFYKNQERKKITLSINLGKNITFDSINYVLKDSSLQKLTEANKKNSGIQYGDPYTKGAISNELDRLVTLYRQNGYFQFTREHIFAHVDSLDKNLFTLSLDPIQQMELMAIAAGSRQKNRSWPVAMERRTNIDSSAILAYKIGKIYYYPETRITDITDSLAFATHFKEINRGNTIMRYQKGLFIDNPLRENTFLNRGDFYNEKKFFKTLNTLGRMGAWQSADAKIFIRDKDTLDMHFFLVPATKQSYSIDLEGSRNTTDIGSGNLWGISTNLSYTNRNVWKRSIQSVTTFRTGVELNILNKSSDPLIQTFHISLGQTYSFPRLILPIKNWKPLPDVDDKRTLLNVTGSYVDRRDFYLLRSLVSSWGYEWKKRNVTWLYKPINVELYTIDRFYKLDSLILTNPFLQTSFNEGRVVGQSISYFKNINSKKNPDKSQFMRFGFEESGSLFALFNARASQIYRFVKSEAEYRQTIKYNKGKNALAMRAFAGVGYNYGTDSMIGNTLPFFKQFFAGGPNSMRAWRLRQIGLGSSIQSDTITSSSYRDRFGDMQLEANIEYRFRLTSIGGFKIESAVFADIGNIWSVKKIPGDSDAQFSLKRLGKDLAIAMGAGIRFDFTYFLIRLDAAYKVKDPARQYNNGWMNNFAFKETRANGLQVDNFALQLGIGLPF
jgi:outer membrane protein insertion porin family